MTLRLGDTLVAGSGANTDLSNLTSQGQNIANWSSNVTNCITEIPQDIKLELNNGTLTLKAGSKLYLPNGFEIDGTTPKFDEVVIESDLLYGGSGIDWSNTKWLVRKPNGELFVNNGDYTSGTTYNGQTYGIWYDTANNLIKYTTDGGSTWNSGYSLPLAQITTTSGVGVSSIDQVFNGFGYIGSTVFALPNLKVLMSAGHNPNGTLNNTIVTNSSVQTMTFAVANLNAVLCFGGGLTANTAYSYDERTNYVYNGTSRWDSVPLAKYTMDSNGKINSFLPNYAFHALDYNDFNNTPHIVETYVNGTSWYRVYSDGWCEQGGYIPEQTRNDNYPVTLLKPYIDTNYSLITDKHIVTNVTTSIAAFSLWTKNKTVSGFTTAVDPNIACCWEAKGYIS